MSRTSYVVLRSISQGPDETFQVVARTQANSPEHAKRLYAEKAAGAMSGAEQLVAVPARNWRPQSVAVATKVVVTLGATEAGT